MTQPCRTHYCMPPCMDILLCSTTLHHSRLLYTPIHHSAARQDCCRWWPGCITCHCISPHCRTAVFCCVSWCSGMYCSQATRDNNFVDCNTHHCIAQYQQAPLYDQPLELVSWLQKSIASAIHTVASAIHTIASTAHTIASTTHTVASSNTNRHHCSRPHCSRLHCSRQQCRTNLQLPTS